MKRETSPKGLEFITRHEGVVLHVYKDVAGLDTIGVGHLIRPGEHFTTITRDEAMALLAVDVKKCEGVLNARVRVPLSQNQFDALVSFTFNLGTGVIFNELTRKDADTGIMRALQAGRMQDVPAEMMKWCKAIDPSTKQHVVVKGLENRRKSEAALFLTPDEEPTPSHEQDGLDAETLAQAQAAVAMSLDRSIREFLDGSDADPDPIA